MLEAQVKELVGRLANLDGAERHSFLDHMLSQWGQGKQQIESMLIALVAYVRDLENRLQETSGQDS